MADVRCQTILVNKTFCVIQTYKVQLGHNNLHNDTSNVLPWQAVAKGARRLKET